MRRAWAGGCFTPAKSGCVYSVSQQPRTHTLLLLFLRLPHQHLLCPCHFSDWVASKSPDFKLMFFSVFVTEQLQHYLSNYKTNGPTDQIICRKYYWSIKLQVRVEFKPAQQQREICLSTKMYLLEMIKVEHSASNGDYSLTFAAVYFEGCIFFVSSQLLEIYDGFLQIILSACYYSFTSMRSKNMAELMGIRLQSQSFSVQEQQCGCYKITK